MTTITDTVGETPLFCLQRLTRPDEGRMWAKWERTNPGGSVKDRPARFIVEEAERLGLLEPGGTIIESSSGNFGISLAMIGAARGYRTIILVDPKTTEANLAVLRAYGAEVVVVREQDDTGSYHKTRIGLANHMARTTPGAFRPDQCFNLMNSEAHFRSTAQELVREADGETAVVVASVSTGGQLGGLGRYFKRYAPHVQIVGVDAEGSAIFGGASHSYLTPGVGLGWTPTNLDLGLIDWVYKVPDEDAFLACQVLARNEGILAGASCGATAVVGLKYAQELAPRQRVICLFSDGGERYLSTIYSDEWMSSRGLATGITPDELRARARGLAAYSDGASAPGTPNPDLVRALDVPSTTDSMSRQAAARLGEARPG